jgi:putative aldouronate transport system permease protein
VRFMPSNLGKKLKRDRYLLLLLFPVILHFVIFSYVPMYGLILAFKDYKINLGYLGSPWVGLKYFDKFFNSIYFWRLIRNTLFINAYTLLFGFPIPILFALAINELRYSRFKKLVQTTSYFPYFISTVIVISLLFTFFNSTDGVVTRILAMVGYQNNSILSDPSWFRSLYVWSGIWQSFGWNSIIYIAAMSSIDPQLYEAATSDGITRFKKAIYITIPCIVPTIILLLLLSIGSMMSTSTEKLVLMLTPSTYEVGDTIASYVYRAGIENSDYSFSTATGLFSSVINLILLTSANLIARHTAETSLW